jgi:hypothetical protein
VARVLARGVVVLGLCALAACSGKSEAKSVRPATPATTVAPTTTTDPRVAPVDQVPEVITVEYVQRVMDALDRGEGDLTRKLVHDRVPTPAFRQMLTAIFDEPAFSQAEASFGRDAARNLDVYVESPGDPATTVKQLLDSSSSCVVAAVDRDLGPQLRTVPPTASRNAVIILRTKKEDRDPLGVNTTHWIITADGSPAPGADLGHACD